MAGHTVTQEQKRRGFQCMDTLLGKWLLSQKQYAALTERGELTLVAVCALRCFLNLQVSHSCEKFSTESKGNNKLLTV